MIRFALAALVMGSLAIPAAAQQPAPAPTPAPKEDILDEVDTPEEEAARDLERRGETATRAQAVRRLAEARNVLRARQETGESANTINQSDDPDIERLERAIRYYAAAHGLSSDIDELYEEFEIRAGATRAEGFQKTDAPREDPRNRWGEGFMDFIQGVTRLRNIRVREAQAKAGLTPISSADTKGGGLSKGAKIGIAAGAVAAVGVLVAAGGDAETTGVTPSQPPVSQTPTAPATPAPGALPTGAFSASLVCIRDPGGHDPVIHGSTVNRLDLTGTAAAITFTGPQPWVAVSGTWDPATGRVSATGRGNVAGFPNIRCTFEGTLTPAGELAGDYVVGVGGGLPSGQTTTYQVLGRRN